MLFLTLKKLAYIIPGAMEKIPPPADADNAEIVAAEVAGMAELVKVVVGKTDMARLRPA